MSVLVPLLLAVMIGMSAWALRHRHSALDALKTVWAHAHWWERVLLCLFIVPIPGPFDELIAATVALRVHRRIRQEPPAQ